MNSGTNSPQGHGRHGSAGRGLPNLPRRLTRGPLSPSDSPIHDPLSAATPPLNTNLPTFSSAAASHLNPNLATSAGSRPGTAGSSDLTTQFQTPETPLSHHPLGMPLHFGRSSPTQQPPIQPLVPTQPVKAFPKLTRPETYHTLPPSTLPASLSKAQDDEGERDISKLLATSQFRSAAILSAYLLTTSTKAEDYERLFELFYVRLAALTLCGQTALAASELKVLDDMSSVLYEHPEKPGQSILPWELRVLAVRLSGLGYAGSDVRRGVLGYYELARECRHHLSTLLTQSEGVGEQKQLWEQRLQDLGVRVAGALIEMEDYGSAAAHLETLPITSTTDRSAAFRQALLWLKIGDVDKAREIIAVDNTEEQCESDFVILALADMADGKYDAAAEVWRGLCERVDRERSSPAGEEMWRVNLGICLLYSGQIGEARETMESILASPDGKSFHALTFNLSTMYELSSDRSRALKLALVDKVAALSPAQRSGMEATMADYKL